MRSQQFSVSGIKRHQRVVEKSQLHRVDIEDDGFPGLHFERKEMGRLLVIEHAAQRHGDRDRLRMVAGTGLVGPCFLQVRDDDVELSHRLLRTGKNTQWVTPGSKSRGDRHLNHDASGLAFTTFPSASESPKTTRSIRCRLKPVTRSSLVAPRLIPAGSACIMCGTAPATSR